MSITFIDEHIGIPFQNDNRSGLHPGATLAIETSKERNGIYQFSNVYQIGYYYHRHTQQVGFIAYKPKFEFRFGQLINMHIMPGFGYAHSLPTQVSYSLENGSYQEKRNWGQPHGMLSLGAGAGLHFNKILDVPIEVFVRYEAMALVPYGDLFSLNNLRQIGLKYTF